MNALRRVGMVAIFASACTRGASDKVTADDAKAPSKAEPPGHVTRYECETTGDYVEADLVAAMKAEGAAWKACAQRVVQMQVVSGFFRFAWKLDSGTIAGRQLGTFGGDGNDCIKPIVARLESTPAFAGGKTKGSLTCRVLYAASPPS